MEFRVAIVASILFWGCDTPRSSGDLVVIAEDAIPAPDVGMADAVVLMDAAVVDATLDTRVPDAAVVDASPDVQPPAPDAGPMGGFCAPCDGSEDCAPGGACLTNRNINESFCGSACESDVDCPRGATCFTLDDGSQQCVPSGATCVGFPPTDFGADCVDDSQCQNGASVCVAAKDKSYCSRPCESDGDCAVGAQFCRDALCRADWTFGPEGCGRDPDRPLPPCSAEGECPDGLQCLSAILPSLPQAIHPICTRGCESNMDCPGETTCQRLSNGVPHCLPAECRCLARPANQSVLDTTLAVAGLDRCDAGFTRQVMGLLRSDVAVDPFRLSFFNRAHQNGYGGLVWAL